MRITIASLHDGKSVEVFPGLFVFAPPQRAVYNDATPDHQFSDDEVLAISESLPHAGIGYVIMEDSLIGQAVRVYNLFNRLGNKRQLGFLINPEATNNHYTPPVFTGSFGQTRYLHSLDTTVLGALMIHNNRAWFDQHPGLAEAALIAFVTHDALTPAASDSVKALDFARFDEDAHYPELIKEPSVAVFMAQHGIDFDLVCAIVRNEGIGGAVLDLADKVAYTARDTINFDGSRDTYCVPWSWREQERRDVSVWTSQDKIAGLWQDIRIDEHGLVITDPCRLYNFLSVRARMFCHLYSGAAARRHEALPIRTLLSFLYQTGELTAEWLLGASDERLVHRVRDYFGGSFIDTLHTYPIRWRSCNTLEEAHAFERQLVEQGQVFVQVDDVRRFFNPATHFLIDTKAEPTSFLGSAPDLANNIAVAGQVRDPIRVYHIEGSQPRLHNPWCHQLQRWRKDKLHY